MAGFAAVNPAYFYALAAVAIPIIIHFLFKARKQQIQFSSVEFILASTVLKSRRIRFKELLLLLLRVAIIALVTLAFARPFLRRNVSAFGFVGRADLAIVLDDSYSMQYREGRRTRFQAAVQRATETIAKCRGGDRVGIVLAAQPNPPALKLTPNFSTARLLLSKLAPTSQTSALAAAIDRAVTMLKSSSADHKVVFVLSDFQQATWGHVSNVMAKLPADVKIKTAHLGKREAPNVAVLDMRGAQDVFTPGDKVDMLARVANYSSAQARGVKVTLIVEGQPKAEKTLDLKPREVREAGFRFTAPESPTLTCQLRLEPGDQLPIDDTFHCVLSKGRPLRVLCVEEKVSDVPYFQETFYLRTALDPTAENLKSISPARATLIERAALEKASAAGIDVMVLADLPGLSESQADHVEKFVRSGGGLVVFLGPNAEPAIYNKMLFKHGTGVLPARILDVVKTLGKGQEYFHLEQIEMAHPIFAVFSRPFSGDLTVPRFTGACKVDTAPCPDAKVLARYDNGLCAVAERKFGLGKCLLFTSTAGTSWSNLPKRMVYVPLVHQMMKHVSSRRVEEQPRFLVGQPAPIPRDVLPQAIAVVVKAPDKRERELKVERDKATVFQAADAPGIYWVEAVGQSKRRTPIWQFGVELATVESDLEAAAPRRIAELSSRSATKAVAVEEAARIEAREEELPPDVWRYLFIAALVCMAVELCIANRGH